MNPPWWGILVVLVVGVAAVWYGWWRDRRRNRAEAAAEVAAPDPIPGHVGQTPTYTTERELAEQQPRESTAETPREPEERGVEVLGGVADPAFFNAQGDSAGGPSITQDSPQRRHSTAAYSRGVFAHPLVLVIDAHLDDDRLLLAPLSYAQRAHRALVLVAPSYGAETLGTLRANAVTGRIDVLPIAADATALRRTVTLTGGLLVTSLDLRGGYLPEQAWGTCDLWTCDRITSWVRISSAEPGAPPDSQPDIQRS